MKTEYWILLLCGILLILLGIIIRIIRSRRERFPYEKRPLLTDNEQELYSVLEPIVRDLGLLLLVKMRMADIMGVRENARDYMGAFNRIKAKHTDFVLCDPVTLEVLVGIELDDQSHLRADRMERDAFVDAAFKACGIPLLHVWNPITEEELRQAIQSVL